MYDKNKNDLYGETLLVFYGNYDFIHMMRKGISSRFGFGQELRYQ